GKSSLINTLLGKKRLVVEVDPTTSLPTYLLHGEQEQITALNLFRRRVILSQDEFASLTHEEKIKYGSQIAGLLRSAFVSDPDFTWKNIALLDTPGYSKPDSEQWSERTDESVARSQLNLSNFIIWVVSATQGTISEDDLKFLATLNADIPKLIVVSRADAKTPEDIAKIVALVKQTTAERSINVLDVIPVSARKKNDYPAQPVVSFLEKWNEQKKGLSFAQNFKRQFVGYSQFVQGKQQQAKTKLEQINKLLFLSDHAEQTQVVEKLQHIEKDSNKEWNDLAKNLEELQNQFFKKMNQLADSIEGYKEQLIDIETLLQDPNCSVEILQSYAERLNDEKLLNLIYQHENCSSTILEKVLEQNIGTIDENTILNILLHKNLNSQSFNAIKHKNNILDVENKLTLKRAYLGDKDAMWNIIERYMNMSENIKPTEEDLSQFFEFLKKAADLEHTEAIILLGDIYFSGADHWIPKDEDIAIQLFKKVAITGHINGICKLLDAQRYNNEFENYRDKLVEAANLGNITALSYLAEKTYGEESENWYKKLDNFGGLTTEKMCYLGFSGEYDNDSNRALYWYKKAAKLGSIRGMGKLGDLYYYGKFVDKNYILAVEWFEKAANLGDPDSMAGLGFIYYNGGYGIWKNYSIAVDWFKKAAKLGHEQSKDLLKDLNEWC
ncbi:MAG: dynamin family protein, partial [Malacoplasma sp.]